MNRRRDVVLDTLTPLGGGYIRDLEDLLSGGKVDVYETPGKTPAPMRRTCTVCTPICC